MDDVEIYEDSTDEGSDDDERFADMVESSDSFEYMDIDSAADALARADSCSDLEETLNWSDDDESDITCAAYMNTQYTNEDIDEPNDESSDDEGGPIYVPSDSEDFGTIAYMFPPAPALAPASPHDSGNALPNITTGAIGQNTVSSVGDVVLPLVTEVIRSYECPICLESVNDKQVASTKCGHIFCMTCIVNALRASAKCPICQKPLKGRARLHEVFF